MKETQRTISTRQKVQGFVLLMLLVAILVPLFNIGWWGVISSAIVGIGVTFWLTGRGIALLVWVIGILLLGLFITATNGGMPTGRQIACRNQLQHIAAAIAEYESDHGCLPPPFTVSATGERLHSWRVLILPYLGRKDSYDQIDLNKPWDDPANLVIGDQMPPVYRCPEALNRSPWWTIGNRTQYVAVVGPNTAWPLTGVRHSSELSTDSQPKYLVMESPAHEQHWMAPTDPTVQEFLDKFQFDGHGDDIVLSNAARANGDVRTIAENHYKEEKLRDHLTIDSPGNN